MPDGNEAPTTRNTLAVMDKTGDTKTTWDPAVPSEIAAARAAWDKAKANGYMGYKVGQDGEPTEVIHSFDPKAGMVIMRPALQGG